MAIPMHVTFRETRRSIPTREVDMTRRSMVFALVGTVMMAATACAAPVGRVYVRTGPPPVVVERRGPVPGPGFVWIGGFYRWTGREYVWVPGHYEHAPRPRARWAPGHWAHGRHGWYFVEGRWR
jgi:hypothetical protein